MPPPACGLTLKKGCAIVVPPSANLACEAKIAATVLRYIGPNLDNATVTIVGKADGSSQFQGNLVSGVTEVSVDARPADLGSKMTVTINGVDELIHTSCSAPYVAGQPAPLDNPKGNPSPNWLVVSFVDKLGNSVSFPDPDPQFVSACKFQSIPVSCDTLGKPSKLTFEYTGGGCPGDNDQGSKSNCSGSIDSDLPVTVTLDGGTLGEVEPGKTFIVPTTGSNTTIMLSNSGGTETNDVHTSCSAPLATGNSFGSLTLVAMDGQGEGKTVLYSYVVGNDAGGALTDITVTDDKLGPVPGSPIESLASGDSKTLTATAFITETTTNTATAVASPTCAADSNPVVVTVLPPPPCKVSIAFKELKDDAVKWTLSNGNQGKATLDTFTLVFPSAFGLIEEVKLDGKIFKSKDSNTYPNGVGSGQPIGPKDWTEDKVEKRQLEPGKSRTLEVKFTDKDKTAKQGDFDLTLGFKEGCIVGFNKP